MKKVILVLAILVTCVPVQVNLFAQDLEELFMKAEELFSKNSLKEAENLYDQYLVKNPDSVKAYVSRGNVLMLLKKIDESMKDFNKAIELNPSYYKAYSGRGAAYVMLQNFDEAQKDYLKALELEPTDATSMVALGTLYYSESKRDEALKMLDKAIETRPNYAEAYRNRSAMKFFSKDTIGALNDINRAIELSPTANVLNTRGAIYRELRRYKEAIDDYNRVLEMDKSNAEALCRRGIAYLYLGNFDQAITDLEAGIKIEPTLEPLVKKYLNEAKEKKKK